MSAIFGKRSQDAQPKTLYKKVNLAWNAETREIELLPLAQYKSKVSMNAEAKCHNQPLHLSGRSREVPAKHCSCGFYAYKDNDDAKNHDQHGNFLAKVVASGILLEHEKGYRYGHQRIEEIVVGTCFQCSAPADRVIITFLIPSRRSQPTHSIFPVCSIHTGPSIPNGDISFDHLSELASRSLPEHAPRLRCYSSSSLVQPWVSEMDIDSIGKEPARFRDEVMDRFRGHPERILYLAAGITILGTGTGLAFI